MDRSKHLEEKSFPQLREMLTNYGTIDIIWFDMGKGLDNDEIGIYRAKYKQMKSGSYAPNG